MCTALICYFVMFGSFCYDTAILATNSQGTSDYTSRNLLKLLGSATFYIGVVNCASNLVWLCFAGYLLLRTTKSMLADLTFYESLKPPPHVVKRYGTNPRGLLWELRDLTFASAFSNIWHFCAQSEARDGVTYPRTGQDAPLLAKKSTRQHQAVVATQPSPTHSDPVTPERLTPGPGGSVPPSAGVSPLNQQSVAWNWATKGPFNNGNQQPGEPPSGYQRLSA
eukprot:Protomagalhaensia_wolfi_Nauph_80__3487@NODE_3539_length_771_cov_13_707650_g2782_i0_p1_GENE_NODE_3539_length_771_cov_13_707650_g2782_i0NODE_3539_length_771_cov_13_707650_g2782_i0_p1_ORF_typecomplete_len235_score29_18DHHC/PF01529_20/0_00014_NODE_3539_length_771_cov_13_707650_g2782_i067735